MPGFDWSLRATQRVGRLVRGEQGRRLAERAAERGLITPDQLEAVREDESRNPGASLLDLLVERGFLGLDDADRLMEEAAAEDLARRTPHENDAPLPPEAAEVAQDPKLRLGHFILVKRRGRGGGGEVWRAWDTQLVRWVAIKLPRLPLDAASVRRRFEREALATARLNHPNIVTAHAVGEEGGRPYLVMPYIEGETLADRRPALPQALEVMITVALAVDHAHTSGVVHRDLKPGNIMLDPDGRVFILDFGLAYLLDVDTADMTRPGEVMGTGSFMSPEQARGDAGARGPATDIYSLGATLYQLVTGVPPFQSETFAQAIARVLESEPRPVRELKPDVSPELEAVIGKAMSKDPAHRYGSAAELAEDLRRLVAGEHVSVARGVSVRHFARRLQKRRPHLALVAAVVVSVTVGWLWRNGRDHGAAVESIREIARFSLETALRLRRAGDVAGMRQVLPRMAAAYERAQEHGAVSAEVEYLMGRMDRVQMEEGRALAHQERALELDPDFLDARYERAVLLSRRYGRERTRTIAELESSGHDSVGVDEVERARPELVELRARIVEDLSRLDTLMPGGPRTDSARAILAFHLANLGDARRLLTRVVAADPLLEEAWGTMAQVEEAARDMRRAEAIYTKALEVDRGYAPHLVGRCEVRRRRGRFDDALKDADAALKIDPALVGARACRAVIRIQLVHDEMMSSGDPSAGFADAERDLTEAIGREETASLLGSRGTLRRYRGIFLDRRGQDPIPSFAAAEADFSRAITLASRRPEYWSGRGRVRTRRALRMLEQGDDPTSELDRAEADLAQAAKLDGGYPRAATLWMGDLQSYRALASLRRGGDAEASFAAAEQSYSAYKEPGRDEWRALGLGTMRTWQGVALARQGRDPMAVWAAAEKDLERASGGMPRHADPRVRRGILRLERARHLGKAGAGEQARGVDDLRQALEREPDHREARAALAAAGDPALGRR